MQTSVQYEPHAISGVLVFWPLRWQRRCAAGQAADLAERSTERATRVAACEFLHASILWMVATNARRPMSRDTFEDFQVRTFM